MSLISVLQINSVNFGSTGNIMIQLNDKLKEKGSFSTIAFADSRSNRRKSFDNSLVIGSVFERNIHLKLSYFTGYNGCFSKRGTKDLIKEIERINPDVIHLHNLHNCYINLEMLFKYIKEKNKPTIWTLHDCWAFTGHCPHYSMVGCNKWKTGCYECPIYDEYPASRVDRSKELYKLKKEWFTGVSNLTIVTPSKWLANEVQQSFLNKYPVEVIYNGIDLDIFKPQKTNFRYVHNLEGKVILLGVAFPWSKRKGLDLFIKLSELLPDNYKIVLVGLSAEQIGKLPEKIIGLPKTNGQSQLAEIYSAADYFINPSMEETMGLVTVEAMACGTPAIVSNLTAVPEMVNEKSGIIVKEYGVKGFLEAIIQTSQNDFKCSDCRAQAENFEANIKYMEYIRLYHSMITEG